MSVFTPINTKLIKVRYAARVHTDNVLDNAKAKPPESVDPSASEVK